MADPHRLNVARAAAFEYRLALRRPFTTGHGTLGVRQGFLLSVTDCDGIVGWGEAAPLAQFGGDLAATRRTLATFVRRASETGAIADLDTDTLATHPSTAPAACAIETAILDITSRRAGVSIAALMGSSAREVAVNAVIGHATLDESVDAARNAALAGYTAVKVKVGTAVSLAEDVRLVAAIRDTIGPQIELRLDANGAFDEATARVFIDTVARLRIAYIEQPTPPGDAAALARLTRDGVIPIAADESAATQESAHRVARERLADVIILKPMIHGGIASTCRIAEVARANTMVAIVTTTIDAGIGTAMALHCAALIDPGRAHGLGTAALLVDDLTDGAPRILVGRMAVPGSGLGVIPHRWSDVAGCSVVPLGESIG